MSMVEAATQQGTTMKAVVRARYGSPDVIELRQVAKPKLTDDGVLVRVRAASVNRVDWYYLTGVPLFTRVFFGLRRPKELQLGRDFAGTVEAVGKDVTDLQPGDDVFGGRAGALAEYVCASLCVVRKPANLTFEEAAAVPLAALTALQALRDKGQLKPGQKVLVNGASGGVGTFAVQLAKALGADVTAVCGPRNVELAWSLGADRVIDYTREDFTRTGERYDLFFDNAGTTSWRRCRRVLAREANVVVVGGPKHNRLTGPIGHFANMRLGAIGSSRQAIIFTAQFNKPDLEAVRELIEAGTVTPVVDGRYALNEIADAFRYLGDGHPRGKVVVTVASG